MRDTSMKRCDCVRRAPAWFGMLAALVFAAATPAGAAKTDTAEPIIAQYCAIFDYHSTTNAAWVYLLDHAPFDKLNRLYIAFAWLKNGRLTYNAATAAAQTNEMQKIDALVTACRQDNSNAAILISSGFDEAGEMYHVAATNPAAFAASVLAFLQRHQLDGYDMDWENGIVGSNMLALLQATSSLLRTNTNPHRADGRYFVTVATWPDPYFKNYGNVTNLALWLDQINVMSYGTGDDASWDAELWHERGMPWSQIIVGVETECDYPTGVDTLGDDGTIAQKCAYAVTNGLAGVMAWRLDNDYCAEAGQTPPPGAHPSFRGALAVYSNVISNIPEPGAGAVCLTALLCRARRGRGARAPVLGF